YQIHFLLAGKGDATMSRWGHAMIRVVYCAPETKFGPDCLLDLSSNFVLSFRAFVGSLQIGTIAGLTGKYPSRLFILPLNQVVDEYNKMESRDLQSIPLKFSRSEIHDFLSRASETHWAYDGKYYFIS